MIDGVDRCGPSLVMKGDWSTEFMYIGRWYQRSRAGGDPTIFKLVLVDRPPVA